MLQSGVQCTPPQPTEGFEQTWAVDTVVDRLAESGTLRNWAFAGTVAHTTPTRARSLLGPGPQPARLLGVGGSVPRGRGVRPAAHRGEGGSASRLTASASTALGCTCPHPFRLTLMAAARPKGANLSPWQAGS